MVWGRCSVSLPGSGLQGLPDSGELRLRGDRARRRGWREHRGDGCVGRGLPLLRAKTAEEGVEFRFRALALSPRVLDLSLNGLQVLHRALFVEREARVLFGVLHVL